MSSITKTCQSCADSKVRCVRNPDITGACTRCRRLRKECQSRQTGRRFKGFQKDRRIAALESKINELMVGRTGPASNDNLTPLSDGDSAAKDIISRGFLDIETAERYVSNFKTKLTPHFPFVVLPPAVSARHLRQQKPFLLLAILASASYENVSLQRVLGHEFKEIVASRMVVGGGISFELLQGLLVFLAWSHYHSKPHRYTQFLQLAISLIIDLRLDRPPQTKMWKTGLRFGPQYDLNDQTLSRPSWGSDEQRATLGCYYLSSSIAMLVQKRSTMLRLPHHEECCQSLLEANEYPQDKYIKYVIQLQHITEKIDNISSRHALDLEKPGSGSELYIANLKSELETFSRHLPFDIHESSLLAIQYHATGLCLYQLALNIGSQQPRPHSPFDSASHSWRDEMAVLALVSATSILNLYIQLPPKEEVGFSNTQWVQLGFALLVAYRHTVTASRPEQTAAFLATLTKVELRVVALSTFDVDANGARDVFLDFRKRVVQIQRWVEELDKRQKDNSHSRTHEVQQQQAPSSEPIDFDFDGLMGAAERLDDPLWDSLSLGAPDSQGPPSFFFGASVEQMMRDWI
ncbi:hypothetical protein BJX70DRAFT_82741 [Aspergillus crustosus]